MPCRLESHDTLKTAIPTLVSKYTQAQLTAVGFVVTVKSTKRPKSLLRLASMFSKAVFFNFSKAWKPHAAKSVSLRSTRSETAINTTTTWVMEGGNSQRLQATTSKVNTRPELMVRTSPLPQ